MEVHTSHRWSSTTEKLIQKKSQVTHLRFLLPRIGLILLASCIAMTIVVQPTYGKGKGGGNQGGKKAAAGGKAATAKGVVQLSGDGENLDVTLQNISLSGLPANAPLVIHIHAKNTTSTAPADACKGPVLFAITGENSDAQGKFSLAKGDTKDFTLNADLTDQEKQDLLKASALNTWQLNVHDAAIPGPDKDPKTGKAKPISVACGPLNAKGVAALKVTKAPAAAPAQAAN